ncbi:MAG: TetR family transcriptional regulator [Pseudomonadota bacterium]
MEAFWIRGNQATSMSDLVAVTGINRGSIYAAFTDKHGLFVRAFQHYDRDDRAALLAGLAHDCASRQAIVSACTAAPVRSLGERSLVALGLKSLKTCGMSTYWMVKKAHRATRCPFPCRLVAL